MSVKVECRNEICQVQEAKYHKSAFVNIDRSQTHNLEYSKQDSE